MMTFWVGSVSAAGPVAMRRSTNAGSCLRKYNDTGIVSAANRTQYNHACQ